MTRRSGLRIFLGYTPPSPFDESLDKAATRIVCTSLFEYRTARRPSIGTAAEERNKAFVLEAFDALANRRDYAAAQRFWSSDYVQHSAHIPPGRDGLFNLVKASSPDRRYENALTVANGDYVMLHGRLSTGGRRPTGSPWTSCGWKTG
jgi:hypothetical protein